MLALHRMNATIRPACRKDAEAIADVHNRSRAEAFRGQIDGEILFGDAAFAITQAWRDYFEDPEGPAGTVAVAEIGSKMVGFAFAVPGEGAYAHELKNLYLLAEAAGSGTAPKLLNAVIPVGGSALLWVAEFNDRAQNFYGKEGFRFDGTEKRHKGDRITLKRMVRG